MNPFCSYCQCQTICRVYLFCGSSIRCCSKHKTLAEFDALAYFHLHNVVLIEDLLLEFNLPSTDIIVKRSDGSTTTGWLVLSNNYYLSLIQVSKGVLGCKGGVSYFKRIVEKLYMLFQFCSSVRA